MGFFFSLKTNFLVLCVHVIFGRDTEYYHELKSRFIKKKLSQIIISQLNFVLLVQWKEQDYICLVFHIKTLCFFKHCEASGIHLLHKSGLTAMLTQVAVKPCSQYKCLQPDINAAHALKNIKTLNGTSL